MVLLCSSLVVSATLTSWKIGKLSSHNNNNDSLISRTVPETRDNFNSHTKRNEQWTFAKLVIYRVHQKNTRPLFILLCKKHSCDWAENLSHECQYNFKYSCKKSRLKPFSFLLMEIVSRPRFL